MHLKKLYTENTHRKHGMQRKQKMPFPLKTNEKFPPSKALVQIFKLYFAGGK